MRCLRVFALALIATVCAQVCFAVPTIHPGDLVLLTRDGHVVLFHPETASWENFANLSPYDVTTSIVRESSGDFLICDEYAAVILRLHAATGAVTVVTQGNELGAPNGLEVGPGGFIYALDTGLSKIVRVDPVTGDQLLISQYHYLQGIPSALRLGPDGNLYVVDEPFGFCWLFRVNIATGDQTLVSEDGSFFNLENLVFAQDGSILVLNWAASSTSLIRVDPGNGSQTELVSGIPWFMTGMGRDDNGRVYLGAGDRDVTTSGALLEYDGGSSVSTLATLPFGVQALVAVPGAGPVPTRPGTWGFVKGLYR